MPLDNEYFNRAIDAFRSADRLSIAPFLLGTQVQAEGQRAVDTARRGLIDAEQGRQDAYRNGAQQAFNGYLGTLNPGSVASMFAGDQASQRGAMAAAMDAKGPTVPGAASGPMAAFQARANAQALGRAQQHGQALADQGALASTMAGMSRKQQTVAEQLGTYAKDAQSSLGVLEPELNNANASGEQAYGLGEMLRQFGSLSGLTTLQDQAKQAAQAANDRFNQAWAKYRSDMNMTRIY